VFGVGFQNETECHDLGNGSLGVEGYRRVEFPGDRGGGFCAAASGVVSVS
jgi:hypothetical protein